MSHFTVHCCSPLAWVSGAATTLYDSLTKAGDDPHRRWDFQGSSFYFYFGAVGRVQYMYIHFVNLIPFLYRYAPAPVFYYTVKGLGSPHITTNAFHVPPPCTLFGIDSTRWKQRALRLQIQFAPIQVILMVWQHRTKVWDWIS